MRYEIRNQPSYALAVVTGRFFFQTRNRGGLLDWLIPRLPRQNSN